MDKYTVSNTLQRDNFFSKWRMSDMSSCSTTQTYRPKILALVAKWRTSSFYRQRSEMWKCSIHWVLAKWSQCGLCTVRWVFRGVAYPTMILFLCYIFSNMKEMSTSITVIFWTILLTCLLLMDARRHIVSCNWWQDPRIHFLVHIRQYPCCTILLRDVIYGQRGSGETTNEGHVWGDAIFVESCVLPYWK